MAFEGLGNSLQILDLSANNITSLPDNLFDNFDVFRFVLFLSFFLFSAFRWYIDEGMLNEHYIFLPQLLEFLT